MFMLSVEAMGRREWKISARLKAGIGDVEDEVGGEAMELAEDLLILSANGR